MTDNEAMRTTFVRTRPALHEDKAENFGLEGRGHVGLEDLTFLRSSVGRVNLLCTVSHYQIHNKRNSVLSFMRISSLEYVRCMLYVHVLSPIKLQALFRIYAFLYILCSCDICCSCVYYCVIQK